MTRIAVSKPGFVEGDCPGMLPGRQGLVQPSEVVRWAAKQWLPASGHSALGALGKLRELALPSWRPHGDAGAWVESGSGERGI